MSSARITELFKFLNQRSSLPAEEAVWKRGVAC